MSARRKTKIQFLGKRFAPLASLPEDANPTDDMRHKFKSEQGCAVHAKKKRTIKHVFGIIKPAVDINTLINPYPNQ